MRAVLLNDTSPARHHGCTRVTNNLLHHLKNIGVNVTHRHAVGDDWKEDPQTVAALNDTTLVVINGEGSIHHDRPYGKTLLEAAEIAKSQGSKTWLLNALWDDNGSEFAKLARNFDEIWLRDRRSLKELEAFGIKGTAVADLTFASRHVETPSEQRTGIGFTDSVFSRVSKTLYACSLRIPNSVYMPMIRPRPQGEISMLRRAHMTLTRLTGDRLPLRQSYRDLAFAEENTDLYVQKLGSLRGLVSGRFHSVCFAIQTATPFLAIASNSHKIEALLEETELPLDQFMITPEELVEITDPGELEARLPSDVRWQNAMRAYASRSADALENMFTQLSQSC